MKLILFAIVLTIAMWLGTKLGHVADRHLNQWLNTQPEIQQ